VEEGRLSQQRRQLRRERLEHERRDDDVPHAERVVATEVRE